MKKLTLAIMTAMIIFTKPCSTNATETYIDYGEEIGGKYNICPELIQAIVEKESNYNPRRFMRSLFHFGIICISPVSSDEP